MIRVLGLAEDDHVGRTGSVGGNNDYLGQLVRKLKVVFQSGSDALSAKTIPNPKEIRDGDLIRREEFIKLVKVLPNLQHLEMELPTFIRLQSYSTTGMTEKTLFELPPLDLTLFSNLTSFGLTTSAFDLEQELLRTILIMAPNISSLSLSSSTKTRTATFSPPLPAEFCPPLRQLTIEGAYYQQILFQTTTPFIPLTSYLGLKTLDVGGKRDGFHHLLHIIKIAGPTLTTLISRDFVHDPPLSDFLPYLTNLITLDTIRYTPSLTFLQEIPPTLKYLTAKIPLSTLHYSYLHPRPETSLRELSLTETRTDRDPALIFSYLPRSVRKVTYHGGKEMVEEALRRDLVPSWLEEFALPFTPQTVLSELEGSFRKLGIDLVKR